MGAGLVTVACPTGLNYILEIKCTEAMTAPVADTSERAFAASAAGALPEVRERIPGWSVWTHPIDGGESVGDVGRRADDVIERVGALDGPVALVAHGHLLRILAARWLGLDPVEGWRFVLDTTLMSILGWEREHRVVRRWNDPCGTP